jgi:hypothetical protein
MASPPQPPPQPPQPTIHRAERASGADGAVEWGDELTVAEAVEERKKGLDIVAHGPDSRSNRNKAREIETAVGTPISEDAPHAKAGRMALPHFHQNARSPEGHSFYEGRGRWARKKKP